MRISSTVNSFSLKNTSEEYSLLSNWMKNSRQKPKILFSVWK